MRDVAAFLQHAHEPYRCVEPGRNQRAHEIDARFAHGVVDCADIRPAIEDVQRELVGRRHIGRKLPIGEMRGENQRRFVVEAQPMEDVVGMLVVDDVLRAGAIRVEDVQAVDMGELGGDAAEIVPDACEDRLDLGRAAFPGTRRRGSRARCGAP